MQFILKYFKRKKEEKILRQQKKADIQSEFELFIENCKPLAPKAKYYCDAALYRFAWKRAVIVEKMIGDKPKLNKQMEYIKHFQIMAAEQYYKVAPTNAFGKVRLEFSVEAQKRMIKEEINRIKYGTEIVTKKNLTLACIYVGYDSKCNRPYIGQTMGDPEIRWKEHRNSGTGPFKKGAEYANWSILKQSVPVNNLDEEESYYIGYYDSFYNGHNENKGNNLDAYDKGVKDRESKSI